MQNLQKTSKFYKIVFKIIFILIVISVPCFWAFAQQDYIPSIIDTAQLYIDEISHPLSLDTRIIGFFSKSNTSFSHTIYTSIAN